MGLSTALLNDISKLNEYVTDFTTLKEVILARRELYRATNHRLTPFIFGNKLFFDVFGQSHKITEFQLTSDWDYNSECETTKYMKSFVYDWGFNRYSDSLLRTVISKMNYGERVDIPSDGDVCPHCLLEWSRSDFINAIKSEENLYHKECMQIMVNDETESNFRNAIRKVFGAGYKIRQVPNRYGSGSYNGSWFIVTTKHGEVRIGWRKRVIEIVWLNSYRKFSDILEDITDTRTFNSDTRLIHAYSYEKMSEYLLRAQNSIIEFYNREEI